MLRPVDRPVYGKSTLCAISSFSTSLRPCSSAGTLPGSCRCLQNIYRHGFLSRLHLKQVNKSSRGQQREAIALYEWDNHINDAGFLRSDGRLVVWACSAAARSRLALKRFSLSFEHSLDTLTRLRWAARRSSLCSLSSLGRLTKFPATFPRRLHKNAPKLSHPRWRQYSITYRHRPDKQSPTSEARPCAPLVSLAPSNINVNFNYMHDCLLYQSEANGPRLDHVTFLLSACWMFCRQREREWIQVKCVLILGSSDVY